MKHPPLSFLPLILLLAACQPDENSAGLIPESERAPQYDRVSTFLDLGGVFYAYMDLTGEIDDMGKTLNEAVQALKQSAPDIPPLPLDLETFLSTSGLSGLQAVGMSSREIDEGYFHNRSILFFPEGVDGLFRIFGNTPRPFDSRDLAPSGADLVFEMSYDAVAVRDTLLEMVDALAGPEEREKFSDGLSEPVPELGDRSVNELIDSMGNRLIVIFEFVDDGEEVFYGPGLSLPPIEFLIGIDGATDLLSSLRPTIESEPDLEWKDTDQGFEITLTGPLPPSMGNHSPILIADTTTGRTLLATSRDYLETSLASGDKLKNTDEFKRAANFLPQEGVSLFYISPGLFEPFRTAFVSGMKSSPAPVDDRVVSWVDDLFFSALRQPAASVTTVGPEGIYSASNSASSHRTTVATLAAQPFAFIGLGAALAIPAFQSFGN